MHQELELQDDKVKKLEQLLKQKDDEIQTREFIILRIKEELQQKEDKLREEEKRLVDNDNYIETFEMEKRKLSRRIRALEDQLDVLVEVRFQYVHTMAHNFCNTIVSA